MDHHFPSMAPLVPPPSAPIPISSEHLNLPDYSKSPTSSYSSFSTAVTSPSQGDPESPSSPTSSSSRFPPPQSLRKSISVDSFVHYSKESHNPVTTRPNRGNTVVDPPRSRVYEVSPTLRKEREMMHQQNKDAPADADRPGSLSSESADGTRRKGLEQSRSFVPAGELPLPTRTPTLSTASSASHVSTSSSSTQDTGPTTLTSTSSLPQVDQRTASFSNGRARSGSLGVYTSPPGRRIIINTQLEEDPKTVIVVIGVSGCGKSAIIRKGLKGYGLSEPTLPIPGTNSSYHYTRRVSKAVENGESTGALHVIEIDLLSDTAIGPSHVDSHVDAVMITYDQSNASSWLPVENLLAKYHALKLPTVVLACKSDLPRQVDPQFALEVIQQYDAGLVEVTNSTDAGKEKMRRSFQWLLKAVRVDQQTTRSEADDYRNPASPDMIITPWEASGTQTPTPDSLATPMSQTIIPATMTAIPGPRSTTTPNSPTRARSTGDLLSQHESSRLQAEALAPVAPVPGTPETSHRATLVDIVNIAHEVREEKKEEKKETRPAQWATLDELLDKLMFLAVSGDDPTFITHFLLTYRRFAAPRSVLLAMQKRMRQLDNPSGDPMFACFAQMRICHLLEIWIRDYPYDFAVRSTAGALSALVKSIISKTYLLHYASDFLPFLEMLPSLVDKDEAWAVKMEDPAYESDDSYSMLDDEEESAKKAIAPKEPFSRPKARSSPPPPPPLARERRPSLPLTSKHFLLSSGLPAYPTEPDSSTRQQLRELLRISQEISLIDSEEIAQEITRMESKLFLDIQPRHWLQYTFVSGKKDPGTNPIVRFNDVSNHLAAWVVSLILCHDRTSRRVRQIEKFVEVAQKLRGINNYSALRAVVAGINSSTFAGDQTMEQFKARSPEQAKNLQSWVVLLQHIRSHRAYRLALRNTKGACIPALEVHMSDLIRSHEGNVDLNESDPTKIHWGKFNMMGRFISSTTMCQAQCRSANDYDFRERPHIRELLEATCVMDEEMQSIRISPNQDEEEVRPTRPAREANHQQRDVLRRIFFW